jgi:hydroxyethylthiazole kinase-like uncharacterized protein yjeF
MKIMEKLKIGTIKSILKPRIKNSHKGTFGHALVIAGNLGKMGAAIIASRACLRSGVGLVTVNVPIDERIILQSAVPEAMLIFREKKEIDFSNFSTVAIGPGIGLDKKSAELLTRILAEFSGSILLDADALNIISANKKLLDIIPKNTIITPHPKEFDRLFGLHKSEELRVETAIRKAKEHDLVIVLKGHKTLITANGQAFLNTTGNAGLAKGGSGDALTGIISAFLAQGYPPFEAAKIGVFLHGLAADLTLKKQSMESMLITDVIGNTGKAFKNLHK